MAKNVFRIVVYDSEGQLCTTDYSSPDEIGQTYVQIGVDDCSTDLGLRGQPVFRGLIGPMPEGKQVVRYESPQVFEALTKEWAVAKTTRRSRKKPSASTIATV